MATICLTHLGGSMSSLSYVQLHGIRKCLQLVRKCSPAGVQSPRVCLPCGMATLADRALGGSHHPKKHWFYQQTEPWTNREELVSDLKAAKLYEDDHMVAFNKPNGLPMHALNYMKDLPSHVLPPQTEELSVKVALPELEETLGTKLINVYSQPRQFSGIILFAKNESTQEKLKKYFRNARTNTVPVNKYWAVCLGIPDPAADKERLGIQRQIIGDQNLTVIAEAVSRSKCIARTMVTTTLSYTTLHINRDLRCSLLEVTPSTTKWDSMQVFLVRRLSPVLGDHTYSCRLKRIMGKPLLAAPESCFPETQIVPEDVAWKLGLKKQQFDQVPLHIHCRKLTVPRLSGRRKETFSISASPDVFFQRTLTLLQLEHVT